MPPAVDICNLALSYIGDVADVQSIAPPDGSVQAGFCSRFYPIALSAMLESGAWGFSTRRVLLAELENNPASTWAFAYAVPPKMINALAVVPASAGDDYTQRIGCWGGCESSSSYPYPCYFEPNYPASADVIYTPQPYAMETLDDGSQIILTNVCDAVLRYTVMVNDANQFSPLFVLALSYLLASMLAGPLIKGQTGAQISAAMAQRSTQYASMAKSSDANQEMTKLKQRVSWMAGR